jgi:hypothetical protein
MAVLFTPKKEVFEGATLDVLKTSDVMAFVLQMNRSSTKRKQSGKISQRNGLFSGRMKKHF